MLTADKQPANTPAFQALRIGTRLFKPISAVKLMDGISSVLGAPLTQGAPNDAVARNIEAIGRRYGARLNDDITQLEGAMAELHKDPTVQRHAWDAMRKTMHSVKGQAGTFGFGLITELASRGQDLLDDTLALAQVEEHDIKVRRALHAIVTAMRMLECGKMPWPACGSANSVFAASSAPPRIGTGKRTPITASRISRTAPVSRTAPAISVFRVRN
jgi:HPt (histidine-containing phosphotransfer) domain-containing protein